MNECDVFVESDASCFIFFVEYVVVYDSCLILMWTSISLRERAGGICA